jgi:hypothetical protein
VARITGEVWRQRPVGACILQSGGDQHIELQLVAVRFNRGRRALPTAAPISATPTGEFVDLGTLNAPAPSQAARFELRLDLGGGVILHLVRG